MSFLPITLGVRRTSDAEKGAQKDRSQIKKQSDKIFKRDDYTCRFCGFRSLQYQRVVSYDGGDKADSLVTACTFCEQCLTLERAGMMGSGILVWLPEIEQVELNHIARAIYVARAEKGDMGDLASRALDCLMTRRTDAKKRLGSDDPLLLATVLHEALDESETKIAITKLEGIRLLPLDNHLIRLQKGDINHFPEIVKYWCSAEGPFGKFPAEKWQEMFKNAAATVGHA